MSWGQFKKSVSRLWETAGVCVDSWENDMEKGRFSARFSDGMEIIARPGSEMATVRFGSDHQAMVNLLEVCG